MPHIPTISPEIMQLQQVLQEMQSGKMVSQMTHYQQQQQQQQQQYDSSYIYGGPSSSSSAATVGQQLTSLFNRSAMPSTWSFPLQLQSTMGSISNQQQHKTTSLPPSSLPAVHHCKYAPVSSSREITTGTKRGSDEMLHQAQILSNGNGVSISPELSSPDLEPHDAKKVRLDATTDSNANQTVPSRVIHARGIPVDSTEAELVQLAVHFGKVTNVMVMRTKKQAFIEMAELGQAVAFIQFHQDVPALLRGKPIYLQYSAAYKELKTEQNAAASAAITAAGTAQSVATAGIEGESKTVLRVIVDNIMYPVTIDVLKQIFSRYGQVLKIVIFNKNNQFQALIQYSDPISAQTAKVSLDGQNIYNNCCTLRIDFSKLATLNIRYNNDKSRDYTNPSLPPGEGIPTSQPVTSNEAPSPGLGMSPNSAAAMYTTSVASLQQSAGPPAVYGSPLTYMNPATGAHQAMHPMSFPVQLPQGISSVQGMGGMPSMPGLGGMPSLGGMSSIPQLPAGLNPATMMSMGLNPAAASQMAANMASIRLPPGVQTTGCVVLVSNLDEENVTPDALFTLFGVYGDVHRVKVLYNKKDNALLQYSEPGQAQLALTHLDKIKVWGKQIRVAPSKHPVVQMPTDMQADGAKLTKDYTNSPLHRYKKKGSKNYQNIYPPSATLHLSNIPPDVSGDLLKDEFAKYGQVTAFKFFEKDHKMALIQMASVEDATMGLIGMHNFQLGDTSHLRVSFSKSTISPPVAPGSIIIPQQ